MFFLLSSGFWPGTLPYWNFFFFHYLFCGGGMNTDLNLGMWCMQFFRCWCGVFYELFLVSLVNSCCVMLAIPGKVHHCFMFAVDNDSHYVSLQFQSLKHGFITLCTLIDIYIFIICSWMYSDPSIMSGF